MTKMFTGNGLFTAYGKEVFDKLLSRNVNELLDDCDSEQEILTMKAALAKYVGDIVSERLQQKLVEVAQPDPIDEMAEHDFLVHIMTKYAPACFSDDYSAMTPRERARYSDIIKRMREMIMQSLSVYIDPVYTTSTSDRKAF